MKIQNIQQVFLAGTPAILFDFYRFEDNAWVFAGHYSAPADAPKTELENYTLPSFSATQDSRSIKKIENIQRLHLNGKASILFEAWGFEDSSWVFEGKHVAPKGTPRKSLLDYIN